MDVISLHQAGIENVVASGGTSLTAEQIRLMHHFTDNITILYDGDKAGIKATLRGIDMVLSEGINVRVVSLPEGEDPDSFARSHNASDVIDFLENNKVDFIRFKTQLLLAEASQDPAQRSEVIHSIVQSISVIPDAITRQVYIKDTAQRLSMTEAILSREVAGARRKDADKETQQIKSNPAPIVQQPIAKNNDTFTRNMLNILRLIVRYGERTLYEDDQQQPVRVGEYIISNLREDEIAPRHPLHQRILDEYMAHYQEPDFVAEKFFSFHEDPEISQLAIALIANRYQLSRIFQRQSISENVVQEVQQKTDADILPELTGKLLLEIKFTVVEERIEALSNELKIAEENHDDALMITLLSTQKQLISIRAQLCKALGNRIIV
jgi:DNA primase